MLADAIDQADRLIENFERSRADLQAKLLKRVMLKRRLELLRRKIAAGRAAEMRGFDRAQISAADFAENLPNLRADRHFDDARARNRAGHCQADRSRIIRHAGGREPTEIVQRQQWNVQKRFDVMNQRRFAP